MGTEREEIEGRKKIVGKIAFIFPGQASQYVGMGKDLYDQFPQARTIYQRANEILGFELTRISFKGPEEELKQTRVTQPAIFVHSVIVYNLLAEKKVEPDFVAGHSLGEYSALVAARALDFEDALKIVRVRAELMQQAGEENPGSMAAIIGLSASIIEEICRQASTIGIVQPANYNSTQQIAISGSVNGVQQAMELAKIRGAKMIIPLVVSGAFHSPLMEHAQIGLKEELKKAHFKEAKIPVYTNVTAEPVTEPDKIKKLLYKQLTYPVRWTELIQNMIVDCAEKFYEIGPGNVLTGLLKRIDRKVKGITIGTFEQINNLQ